MTYMYTCMSHTTYMVHLYRPIMWNVTHVCINMWNKPKPKDNTVLPLNDSKSVKNLAWSDLQKQRMGWWFPGLGVVMEEWDKKHVYVNKMNMLQVTSQKMTCLWKIQILKQIAKSYFFFFYWKNTIMYWKGREFQTWMKTVLFGTTIGVMRHL